MRGNSSEGGGPGRRGGGRKKEKGGGTISVCNFPMLCLARGNPLLDPPSIPRRHRGLRGLGSLGGPSPRPSTPAATAQTLGSGGGGRGRAAGPASGTKPAARSNKEVLAAPARPPLPPAGPRKHPRLTTCRGRGTGGAPRTRDAPQPRPPSPQELGLGGHRPAARPRRKGQLGAARGVPGGGSPREARPSRRDEHPRRPRGEEGVVSRPRAGGPPGLTPRSALRVVGPRPRPLRADEGPGSSASRGSGERVRPRPPRHFPVPTAPHSAGLRQTLPPGPVGTTPGASAAGTPRSAADTARRPRPPAPLTSSGSGDAGHRKTPGSPTPALLDPPLRLTPLVSRQNGAGGRALTSRPFPSPFSFHHSLPARGGTVPAAANECSPAGAPTQSPSGARGFQPIPHYPWPKSRKKPGSC